jgi:hypothetical protein
MELTVKATGYGWICRTNSADVKNIAYDEQSDCLLRRTAIGLETPNSG